MRYRKAPRLKLKWEITADPDYAQHLRRIFETLSEDSQGGVDELPRPPQNEEVDGISRFSQLSIP